MRKAIEICEEEGGGMAQGLKYFIFTMEGLEEVKVNVK
jgi:hypothetical protein